MTLSLDTGSPELAVKAAQILAELVRQGVMFRAEPDGPDHIIVTFTGGF